MRSPFVAIYWLVNESSSSTLVTMYPVAEEGQVKMLEEGRFVKTLPRSIAVLSAWTLGTLTISNAY
jgi:hypothetical protein